jgi:hypothetical protein
MQQHVRIGVTDQDAVESDFDPAQQQRIFARSQAMSVIAQADADLSARTQDRPP